MSNFQLEMNDLALGDVRLVAIGVGGGGCNAINTMIGAGVQGVTFVAANTDAQSLAKCAAPTKIQLGAQLTRGRGAGTKAEIGRAAAEECLDEIRAAIDGADMVFVAAGMGGGTGTGAAPVVARLAREMGAVTVGVVTRPFVFEGPARETRANQGILELWEEVDSLLVVPNERLLAIADEDTSWIELFQYADSVLMNGVRGVSDIITENGVVNVDFADVQTVMSARGLALMGMGEGSGVDGALVAVEQAISSPLLDGADIDGAGAVLVNFTAGLKFPLLSAQRAMGIIRNAVSDGAEIVMGISLAEDMEDTVRVTVIATGFPDASPERLPGHRPQGNQGYQARPQAGLHNPITAARPAFNAVQDTKPEPEALVASTTHTPNTVATAASNTVPAYARPVASRSELAHYGGHRRATVLSEDNAAELGANPFAKKREED